MTLGAASPSRARGSCSSTLLGAAAERTQAVHGRLRDARAQRKSGHLDSAQRAVESVLERTPQSVAALLLLGEVF